jgi:NitT/TauT family transport system permease protein
MVSFLYPRTRYRVGARQWRAPLLRASSLVVCLAIWQLAASHHLDLGFVSFSSVPTPLAVVEEGRGLWQSQALRSHITASLLRVFGGYGVAAVVGIGLGLGIGRSRLAGQFLLPPLEWLRPIPAVAWVPLAVLMFPSAELSMVFITFTGALFPILLNTLHAVETVDKRLVAAARSLGCSGLRLFREVIVPAAAPGIFTGLSIGMGTAWFCLVSAEMIAGQFGLGYYTWSSYTVQNYAAIVLGMLMIGALGMLSSLLLKTLGRLLMPWRHLENLSR